MEMAIFQNGHCTVSAGSVRAAAGMLVQSIDISQPSIGLRIAVRIATGTLADDGTGRAGGAA